MSKPNTAKEVLDQLGAKWSPDMDDFVSGKIDLSQMRCALCTENPCVCPEFGTPEYFALIDKRHGK
jgi:hypothetical protein